MIPLKDSVPRIHFPAALYAILALNGLAFMVQMNLSHKELYALFHVYGVIPARFVHPEWSAWTIYPQNHLSFVTYMFLHGGWMHFLINMWTLWIFADNVEDVMGGFRFAAFYLTCGLAALATHIIFNPDSVIPVMGASGAIAGVMGAYLLLYPRAKVFTLIPIIIIPYFIDLPAVLFLGLWFLGQILSGLSSLGADPQAGGIAWWAHSGGFIAGMLLLPLFRNPKRCFYRFNPRTRSYQKTCPGFGRNE